MDYTLTIGNHSTVLDPTKTYSVYGEDRDADFILDLDFTHLNWLDQRVVIQSIELREEISILFHPDIIQSLEQDFEGSPYWQKTRFEALSLYRRSQLKEPEQVDKKLMRALAKPVNLSEPKYVQKRFRIVNLLVTGGFEREDAKDWVQQLLDSKGSGVMNLKPPEIVKLVDKMIEEKVEEETGVKQTKYFTKTSQERCTLYYLKFTHNVSNEEFKKIGITVRPLNERFYMDIKDFTLDIIHTVEYTAERAQVIEDNIKKTFRPFKYTPMNKLKKGGDTECFTMEIDDFEVMNMMGRNQVL